MNKTSGLKFEFPVVRSELSPERREAIAHRFMQVASLGETLKRPTRYGVIRKKNIKKG